MLRKIKAFLLVLAALLTVIPYGFADSRQKDKEEQINIDMRILNTVTGGVVLDTLTVDLLTPDSILIYSRPLSFLTKNNGMPMNYAPMRIKAPGENFIIRLSHPDYETSYYPVKVDKKREGLYNLKIRKLTRREKEHMLDEVTVTASVVQFVHKGDTLQYNADAFELAEGSMLQALIARLPGAELKENGQIYVNGRFVNKLLLDGKDFFQNDKLVLLQNLPAYTVKHIQVYEQRLPEQLARNGSSDPNLVMDVKLKKDFNAGWLANAEAGGGTHSRYRLRGFGLLYTTKSRFAAYALANNLNETGSPDMSGGWKKKSEQRNQVITKGGGFDYYIEPKEQLSVNGNVTAQYQTVFSNSLTNTQNYIPQGDNYTRRWNDSHLSDLRIHSGHELNFNIKDTYHTLNADFDYGNDRSRSGITEGTFGSIPGDWPSMRPDLQSGMPDTLNILNRYLSLFNSDSKRAEGGAKYSLYYHSRSGWATPVSLWGNLSHRWQDASQHYLLQYAGAEPSDTRRTNPQNAHGYKYGADLRPGYFYKDLWWTRGHYRVENSYDYSSTMFYDLSDNPDEASYPFDARQYLIRMQRTLDTHNSYVYGLHTLDQSFSWNFVYDKREVTPRGARVKEFQIVAEPMIRYVRRKMDFMGYDPQTVRSKILMPGAKFYILSDNQYRNRIKFEYSLTGREPLMTDMLDMQFNSDPLNPTVGNPGLKYELRHKFELTFQTNRKFWNKLYLTAKAAYFLRQRTVVYGSSYDVATGIRTTRPENVNGNRHGEFQVYFMLAPERTQRFFIYHMSAFHPSRYVSLISNNGVDGMRRSVSHSDYWFEWLRLQYQTKQFTLFGEVTYKNEHVTSRTGDFLPYTIQSIEGAVSGLVRLPLGLELSTEFRLTKRYGYSESSLNDLQPIWNAKITKSFLKGSLLASLEGYDMLDKSKRIGYDITASHRRETYYNFIPSYFMVTVQYHFAKKPRN